MKVASSKLPGGFIFAFFLFFYFLRPLSLANLFSGPDHTVYGTIHFFMGVRARHDPRVNSVKKRN